MQQDNALIKKFKRGDHVAFETLYEKHRNGAYFYALAMVGRSHAAEEAVQEAFIAFVGNVRSYRPEGSFKTYLYKAVRSRVLDAVRRIATRREVPDEPGIFEEPEPPVGGKVPEGPLGGEDLRPLVEDALLGLPEEQREVVVMKIYNDMTFREIAEALDISAETAASRFRYAKEKLRSKLMGYING